MRISDWSSDVCSSDLTLANPIPVSTNPAAGQSVSPSIRALGGQFVSIAGFAGDDAPSKIRGASYPQEPLVMKGYDQDGERGRGKRTDDKRDGEAAEHGVGKHVGRAQHKDKGSQQVRAQRAGAGMAAGPPARHAILLVSMKEAENN